ncbi:MAG: DUF296 domain-containing protein [Rhizobiaceae bacterium]|nr:DUF296 domain-containing protein [Rhizobiaceae bacterium]
MRTLRQPGAATEPRALAVPCGVRSLRLTFAAGMSVLDAVEQAFRPHGIESAIVRIAGGAFDPLVYVMPAPSVDGIRAAWYSKTHSPNGRCPVGELVFTYGRRDGAPFLHCHGTWRHADDSLHAGHLMPHDARFAEPVEADVLAISGAVFDQLDDAETMFKLFTPVPLAGAPAAGAKRGVLCRVKPNAPIHAEIERVAAEHDIHRGTVHGIGSLVGCDFADGRHMASIASELFIRSGTLETRGDKTRAELDLVIVDIDGEILEGPVVNGTNNVCITFELLIVES